MCSTRHIKGKTFGYSGPERVKALKKYFTFKVTIECEKTGYSTEMEFKLRPFLGGGELTNAVSGRLKLGKETLATLDGHWDEKVMFKVGIIF